MKRNAVYSEEQFMMLVPTNVSEGCFKVTKSNKNNENNIIINSGFAYSKVIEALDSLEISLPPYGSHTLSEKMTKLMKMK